MVDALFISLCSLQDLSWSFKKGCLRGAQAPPPPYGIPLKVVRKGSQPLPSGSMSTGGILHCQPRDSHRSRWQCVSSIDRLWHIGHAKKLSADFGSCSHVAAVALAL